MSRLIVKNLPEKIKETRLREVFSCQGGEITDVKLCFTKKGVFRKFAFIGYKNEKDATSALQFLDKTFIDTSKIQVEICKDLGDQTVPRPWSKYAKGSSAFLRKNKDIDDRKDRIKKLQEGGKSSNKKKDKKEGHVLKELTDVKDDPEFQEFLAAHSNKSTKQTWTNDNISSERTLQDTDTSKEAIERDKEPRTEDRDKVAYELDEHSSDESTSDADELNTQEEPVDDKLESKNIVETSDLDWLKSKVTKTNGESSDSYETTSTEKTEQSRDQDASSGSDSENSSDEIDNSKKEKLKSEKNKGIESTNTEISSLTIKMRGIPFKCTEEEIVKFFKPSRINDIRLQRNLQGKSTGYAFVDFESLEEAQNGMKRDQHKIRGRYVELFMVHNKKADEDRNNNENKWKKKNTEEDEDVSDSGRLFIRNLSYSCTEEDLQALFSTCGPLVEVNVPIDKDSNKSTGYAFVTFMMPEHAVKAMNELDGKIFQGRILHLLPGKAKKSKHEETDALGGTSAFKKKKEAEQKVLSGSSHNWNALFLGANAIADVMAARLNASKHDILNTESAGSVAVRMALGETELVSETRKFLESHGVKLDVFGQANSSRSKAIILVKNLPPGTLASELKEIFEKYGDIGQILMPPFGITAIIEFIQSKEAKNAFSNLAYSKFKHTPLFLEWAPVDILTGEVTVKKEEEDENDAEKDESDQSDALTFDDISKKIIPSAELLLKMRAVSIRHGTSGLVLFSDPSQTIQTWELTEQPMFVAFSAIQLKDAEEISGNVVFVKNLNFDTNEDTLKERFQSCGKLRNVTVAKKKDPKKAGSMLSMGYGFVEYKKVESADKAIKLLQHCELDGHKLELKKSHRETIAPKASRKRASETKQASSKIIVRNVPFEATSKEIRELFSAFGTIKTVRLPKKMAGTGSHRGFSFVDFNTKQEAKTAFKALCQSTHLYGRRLVLEWADEEDSVELLRRKTAEHYHESGDSKRRKTDLLSALDKTSANEIED